MKAQWQRQEKLIEVSQTPVVLGRKESLKCHLPDNKCSSTHCKMWFSNKELWIQDLQSKNGTLVNGVRIEKSRVFAGDSILIGDTTILIPSAYNSPEVIEALTFDGGTQSRNAFAVRVEESENTLARHNPKAALQNPSRRFEKGHGRINGHSKIPPAPKDKLNERWGQRWRHAIAWSIDAGFVVIAICVPFRWYGHSPKQLLETIGLSLISGLIALKLDTIGNKGTIGQRFTGLADVPMNERSR